MRTAEGIRKAEAVGGVPGVPRLEALPPAPVGKTSWPWTAAPPALEPRMPDGGAWPRITIVTPSFNQVQWLETTIRSVLLQGYPNLEYIVVDGASTDGSVDVVRKYDAWLDDWRSEPDGGQPDAINKGLAAATGEILGWINSDDLLMPGALRHVALLTRERPDAVAWVGGCYRIDTDGRVTDTILPRGLDRDTLADWGKEGFFYQPSCFFAAGPWREIGSLDERLEYGFDVDLWLKLAERGPFVGTDEVLSAALFHPLAKSGQGRMGQHVDTIALQVYHGHFDAAIRRLERLVERRRVRDLIWPAIRSRVRQWVDRLTPSRRAPQPLLEDVLDAELARLHKASGAGTDPARAPERLTGGSGHGA